MSEPDPPIGWALLFWLFVAALMWVGIILVGAWVAMHRP